MELSERCLNSLRRKVFGLAIILSIFSAPQAVAQTTTTGNFWYSRCERAHDLHLHCVMFVRGIIEMHELATVHHSKAIWCLPGEASVDQAIKVVLAHLHRKPEQLHRRFSILVAEALIQAFPCKR